MNFITIGHKASREPGGSYLLNGQLRNGYTVRQLNHTHPASSESSKSDNKYKTEVSRIYKNRGTKVPQFNIYFVPEKTKIPY
ncbi:MAG: JAB-like toxin 1 domain-containing protein [Bacilli bacterium]